jgi:hypothetical protein
MFSCSRNGASGPPMVKPVSYGPTAKWGLPVAAEWRGALPFSVTADIDQLTGCSVTINPFVSATSTAESAKVVVRPGPQAAVSRIYLDFTGTSCRSITRRALGSIKSDENT